MVDGVTIERLAGTPPLPIGPERTTVGLQRITFQPDATFEMAYRGPVLYYVERGLLGFEADDERLAIIHSGIEGARPDDRDRPRLRRGTESTLSAGYALYAAEGRLGSIRNVGDDPLVVLAVLIVPQPGPGEIEAGGGAATAVSE